MATAIDWSRTNHLAHFFFSPVSLGGKKTKIAHEAQSKSCLMREKQKKTLNIFWLVLTKILMESWPRGTVY